ncbi:MAG: hypothetical protein ACYCZ1_04430 [Candidatus Humimicrobiaceae bacterium]
MLAATGRDINPSFNKDISKSTGRKNSYKRMNWLPFADSLQTIEIVLPNIIHGCKRKNLKHL